MDRLPFTGSPRRPKLPKPDAWVDRFWVLGLLLAALLLFAIGLGDVPLRDWDEGIVARVAQEIAEAPDGSLRWLYPTLWGEPYLNKPPLVHGFIALTYKIGGVNEWTARLFPALLTAMSVPVLYGIARELFFRRTPAIFAALIYLTLLPVARHGRLAMLDGAVLCFWLLLVLCLLRSRRDLRYSLGVGLSFAAICLTKGAIGVLLLAIAAVFVAWDIPRLLTSWYMWGGLLLGSVPVAAWYAAQWSHYGDAFLSAHLISQSLERLWQPVEDNSGAPWYYLLEVLKYAWPWLLFVPQSLKLTWDNQNMGWAKLILAWSGSYFAIISLMGTKLPWYVLPVYPALALATGTYLAEIWQPSAFTGMPREIPLPYPRSWIVILGLLATGSLVGSVYFSIWKSQVQTLTVESFHLSILLAMVALTMAVAGFLVVRRDAQFLLVLFWGMYLSLLLFFTSEHWVWELNEDYPVQPVAQMVQEYVPADATVYTSHPHHRPSLNFYSDRQVIPVSDAQLRGQWKQEESPYLLVSASVRESLSLDSVKLLDREVGWQLVTRKSGASEEDGDRE